MTARRRVVCISQARMTSTRLPGKVLMEVAGKPLLLHHLGRLRRANQVDSVVLATTTNATDDPVAELAENFGVTVFRGDEHDVLSRFAGAAAMVGADIVVRVTADCPLIDPGLIDQLVDRYMDGREENPPIDYLGIDTSRYPRGFDAEVFARSLLDEADRSAVDPAEREHVTPFIYRRPERFRLGTPLAPQKGAWPYRLCVDEPDDLEVVRLLLGALLPQNPALEWQDCCKLLAIHPEWVAINRAVAQRKAV